ncbi:MAG: phospho-N-acetylmuramoyl-pentapeptide-transferase [Caldisericia bacterium]|jgi:phospho-N-acetylmuramoyl-pentapeptide-transferase|nr:phospho-N-acetylmuramoyl-pentapeptide-transferase [Caldisericia bacterium]
MIETLIIFIFLFLSYFLFKILIIFQRKRKKGQVVREEGPKTHLNKSGTPTFGGVIFIISFLLVYLFLPKDSLLNNFLLFVFLQSSIGFIDDFMKVILKSPYGLIARYKLPLQFIFSIPALIYFINTKHNLILLPFTNRLIEISIPLFTGLFLFFVVGGINSFNFADGLDGLLCGLSLILLPLFIFLSNGIPNLNKILLAIFGTLISFLWFNFHPAEIFMGDTGSTFLGAFFMYLIFLFRLEILMPLILFLFGLEIVSVILQVGYFKITKKLYGEGKRIFKMAPIHHHFELMGIPEEKVTVKFWIIQIILVIITFSLIYFGGRI